jgi:hypothetical protein
MIENSEEYCGSHSWSKLPKTKKPEWLDPLLKSLNARVVFDSDYIYWRFEEKHHLSIDVDKLLFYSSGNPLQFREYYLEID